MNEGLKPAKTFTIPDIQEDNGGGHIKIPTGSTDVEQSLNMVDEAKFLIIETTEDISVKLDSNSNTAIPIKAYGSAPKLGIFVLFTTSINSIFFTNSSGNEAKVGIFFGC
jgi:hypothetical protein